MEWRLRLRFDRIYAPERKYMASRNWRHSLLARHAFSHVGAPAFSERDLARVCAARGKLSLFGDPCLLPMGIAVSCGPRGPDQQYAVKATGRIWTAAQIAQCGAPPAVTFDVMAHSVACGSSQAQY